LLKRVDTIPVSLALAQAANESAWGTSRFALEGNNLFGQWCYDEGCGLVPNRRRANASHEVQSFESIEAAVRAYFMNINTHDRYQGFRDLRFQMRSKEGELDPFALAWGLDGYSERGEAYVDEVQTIILQNDLTNKDRS
jgi:Bax protein